MRRCSNAPVQPYSCAARQAYCRTVTQPFVIHPQGRASAEWRSRAILQWYCSSEQPYERMAVHRRGRAAIQQYMAAQSCCRVAVSCCAAAARTACKLYISAAADLCSRTIVQLHSNPTVHPRIGSAVQPQSRALTHRYSRTPI